MRLVQNLTRLQILFAGLVWGSAVAFTLVASSLSYGQAAPKYLEDPIDTKLNEKDLASKKKQATATPGTEWINLRGAVAQYYNSIVFPRMTQISALEQVAAIRREYVRDVDRAATPQIRQDLISLAGSWASKHASNAQYHPAVRANAALLMADLDQAPLNSAANEPPVPATFVVGELAKILEDKTTANDALRPVALYGMSRHVRLARDPSVRGQAALALLGEFESACPSGRDPQAHAYLQSMAFEGFLPFEVINANTAVIKRLLDAATDESRPSLFRVRAARMFPGSLIRKILHSNPNTMFISRTGNRWLLSISKAKPNDSRR